MLNYRVSDNYIWAAAYEYFFENTVKDPDNEGFRYLISKYKFPDQQIKQNIYGLGWSTLGDGLTALFSLKGIDLERAEELRLIRFEDGNPHDVFQNRIIFPFRNVKGEIVGFLGLRTIRGEEPVYLGTRSCRFALFGLDVALPFIKDLGFAEILESPVRVIDEYYSGRQNAIIPPKSSFMSIAEKEEFAKIIKSIANRVLIKYDSDHLGIKLAKQDKQLFESFGISVDIEI